MFLSVVNGIRKTITLNIKNIFGLDFLYAIVCV